MEKLVMCRICLVENVSMYMVVDKNLHEVYEKLTDVPFNTEDSRPMLACFICCTKLKQCRQFQRKCLEAEELLTQMVNEDYKSDLSINRGQLSYYNGFVKTSIENINILDVNQTESVTIKEEIPAVCEILDDNIEPKQQHQTEELKLQNLANSHPGLKVLPALYTSEGPVIWIKSEVENEQTSKGPSDAKKPKLDKRREIVEDTITGTQKKNENNQELLFVSTIQNAQNCNNRPLNTTSACIAATCRKIINKNDIILKIVNKDITIKNVRKKNISILHNQQSPSVKEKRYKCDICQRCFGKKCHLTKHSRIHTGEKPFQCKTCQRSFNDKSHLNDHTRIHTGEKPFKCDVCQRSFSKKSHLKCHVRVHSGEELYKCDICQRSFNQQCHLRRHTRTHTGEKPYTCDICQRSFSTKDHLRTHMRTHTGEKPFKCEICRRRFNQKIHLTRHVCVRASEEPYECKICHRRFSLKSALSNHINTHAKRTGEEPKHYVLGS